MAITIKTPDEIAVMREGGIILANILNKLGAAAQPGVSTGDVDDLAQKLCDEAGVKPGFLNYHGFAGRVCTSINDEVVHCIPSKTRILKDGDIIKLDFGILKDGFNTDACQTFAVGTISPAARQLMDVTKASLYAGIAQAIVGNRIGDIGHAVESTVTPYGYSPVRETVGHGIGRRLHEDPEVPNWGRPGVGPRLEKNMTICIEPIINAGTYRILTGKNGWDTRTADSLLSAHYEHTLLITDGAPEILTPWDV